MAHDGGDPCRRLPTWTRFPLPLTRSADQRKSCAHFAGDRGVAEGAAAAGERRPRSRRRDRRGATQGTRGAAGFWAASAGDGAPWGFRGSQYRAPPFPQYTAPPFPQYRAPCPTCTTHRPRVPTPPHSHPRPLSDHPRITPSPLWLAAQVGPAEAAPTTTTPPPSPVPAAPTTMTASSASSATTRATARAAAEATTGAAAPPPPPPPPPSGCNPSPKDPERASRAEAAWDRRAG